MPSCKALFTDLRLQRLFLPTSHFSTKVYDNTLSPKRTYITSDVASPSLEGAPTQLPPQKQHLARLSPLIGNHICALVDKKRHLIQSRGTPIHTWSLSLQLQPPWLHQLLCIFKRDRISITKIDKRQHHTVCNFYPALIPLVTGLLVHATTRLVQQSHIDTFMRPSFPCHNFMPLC